MRKILVFVALLYLFVPSFSYAQSTEPPLVEIVRTGGYRDHSGTIFVTDAGWVDYVDWSPGMGGKYYSTARAHPRQLSKEQLESLLELLRRPVFHENGYYTEPTFPVDVVFYRIRVRVNTCLVEADIIQGSTHTPMEFNKLLELLLPEY